MSKKKVRNALWSGSIVVTNTVIKYLIVGFRIIPGGQLLKKSVVGDILMGCIFV